jgi:hypothetical protein
MPHKYEKCFPYGVGIAQIKKNITAFIIDIGEGLNSFDNGECVDKLIVDDYKEILFYLNLVHEGKFYFSNLDELEEFKKNKCDIKKLDE